MAISAATLREREPWSDTSIRFRDCDPFGHLHNSRFADYMLDAREDHLRACYGLDLKDSAVNNGLGWLITSLKVSFFAPAAISEPVRIFTRLIDYNDAYLYVEARMYGKSKGDLKALLWWSFRAFDTQAGKTRDNSPEIMALCSEIVNPIQPPITFDDRLKSVPRRIESFE